jgi:AcrR family transcriptional regulator
MTEVKRSYDATGRRAQAERTGKAIVTAARRLLLSEGYAATTVARVASASHVSVELIYKRFGGKPGLVRAVVEAALRGAGQVPAETRSDALPAADGVSLVRGWGRLTAEVAPKVAPVLLLVRAAAAQHPELLALAAELDDARRVRMTANARRLFDAGHVRPGLSVAKAADVMWTFSSPELYDLLVQRSGWDLEAYGAFVADGLIAALLDVPAPPVHGEQAQGTFT